MMKKSGFGTAPWLKVFAGIYLLVGGMGLFAVSVITFEIVEPLFGFLRLGESTATRDELLSSFNLFLFVGAVLIGLFCLLILDGGISFVTRKRFRPCVLVAALTCMIPLYGTVLGATILLYLARPGVRELFGDRPKGIDETARLSIARTEPTNEEKTVGTQSFFFFAFGVGILYFWYPLIVERFGWVLGGVLPVSEVPREGPVPPFLENASDLAVVLAPVRAVLMLIAWICLACRIYYPVCILAAAIACASFPIGTLIGVYTFMHLTQPEVRVLFKTPKREVRKSEVVASSSG